MTTGSPDYRDAGLQFPDDLQTVTNPNDAPRVRPGRPGRLDQPNQDSSGDTRGQDRTVRPFPSRQSPRKRKVDRHGSKGGVRIAGSEAAKCG